jgi:hypothetical protein
MNRRTIINDQHCWDRHLPSTKSFWRDVDGSDANDLTDVDSISNTKRLRWKLLRIGKGPNNRIERRVGGSVSYLLYSAGSGRNVPLHRPHSFINANDTGTRIST